jgi:hypothetical protein
MARSNSQKSFQKALYLSVAFVIVLLIANGLLKFVSHPGNFLRPHMDGGNANLVDLDTNEVASIKKKNAGFWFCSGIQDRRMPFLSVSDRIELKDNGIFWRVRHDAIHLPSGDSVGFTAVTNGYMQPFYKSKTRADSIVCQVHFIGQVMTAGSDTCYIEHTRMSDDPKKSVMPDILRTKRLAGEVASDTAWDIIADGNHFGFDGREYSVYDTAGPALYSFFPKGATRLVGKISVVRCSNGMYIETFAKQAIVKDFAAMSVQERTKKEVLNDVDTYYKVMFAENLAKTVTRYGKGTVTLSFSVTSQGTVIDPRVVEAKPLNMKLNNELKKEIRTWRFSQCANQPAPLNVTFSFSY